MAVSLLQRRKLVVPTGFGWWIVFLVAVAGSALSLERFGQLSFFSLRAAWYLSATVFAVYLLNGGAGITVWRIIRAFTYYWMATVAGGYLAYVLGDFSFQSPLGYLLPGFLQDNEAIGVTLNPSFADTQEFLGFPVPRSKAPFSFTNGWGSMMALLTPFALMTLNDVRVGINQKLVRLMLFASVVPIVTSLNRGLWLSLGAGVLYAILRSGRVTQVVGRIMVLLSIGIALFYITPLGDLVLARLNSGHSDTDRTALATEAIRIGLERPIFGWGTTRTVAGLPAPLGTHGQLWNLIFVHGLVGLTGWAMAMFTFFKTTLHPVNRIGLWAHTVIFMSSIQVFFYLQVPEQLFTVLGALVVAIRIKELGNDRPEVVEIESKELTRVS